MDLFVVPPLFVLIFDRHARGVLPDLLRGAFGLTTQRDTLPNRQPTFSRTASAFSRLATSSLDRSSNILLNSVPLAIELVHGSPCWAARTNVVSGGRTQEAPRPPRATAQRATPCKPALAMGIRGLRIRDTREVYGGCESPNKTRLDAACYETFAVATNSTSRPRCRKPLSWPEIECIAASSKYGCVCDVSRTD